MRYTFSFVVLIIVAQYGKLATVIGVESFSGAVLRKKTRTINQLSLSHTQYTRTRDNNGLQIRLPLCMQVQELLPRPPLGPSDWNGLTKYG